MAIEPSCSSCDELRQTSPEFVLKGLTDEMLENLADGNGLVKNDGRDTCEDLHDMNDCLIGNMASEVDSYNVCDWKTFAKRFVPNVWTVLKGMLAWLCRLDCAVNYLYTGQRFNIKETAQTDSAYIVLGKGCSLYNNDSAEHTTDILLNYIAGGLLRLSGSIYFYSGTGTFQDAKAVPNFDNGETMNTSQTRQKNSHWGVLGRPAVGGELIYEIRLKKSEYPQIKNIYGGRGGEANSGAYSVHFQVFDGDNPPSGQDYRYAYGQHGWCHDDGTAYSSSSGAPYDNTYDKGHRVEPGWFYIQCRMHWIDEMSQGDNKIYSPYGWLGVRMKRDEISC